MNRKEFSKWDTQSRLIGTIVLIIAAIFVHEEGAAIVSAVGVGVTWAAKFDFSRHIKSVHL